MELINKVEIVQLMGLRVENMGAWLSKWSRLAAKKKQDTYVEGYIYPFWGAAKVGMFLACLFASMYVRVDSR